MGNRTESRPDNGSGSCGPRQDGDRGPHPNAPTATTITVESGLAATIVCGADAFGADSLASATVDMQVLDRGLVSFASGTATLVAAAAATGGAAFAATSAVVDISGADLGTVTTTRSVDPSGSLEVSTVSFAALDIKFDLPALSGGVAYLEYTGDADHDVALDGNVASFEADIYAEGQNSFTDLQADAIAVEGQLSTVTLAATAAVSSAVTYVSIVGTGRNDRLDGTDGDDVVSGARGDDVVRGGAGDDWLFGDDGVDTLSGGDGGDTQFGGRGADLLYGAAGDDWLFGGKGDDLLEGGGGGDLLMGGDDRDRLRGGEDSDLLAGGAGRDTLEGGAGDDVFLLGAQGGDGDDTHTGGGGADLYLVAGQFDNDLITDFSIRAGDRLVFDDEAAFSSCTMRRAKSDADDLQLTFRGSVLILDEFLKLNPQLDHLPKTAPFSAAETDRVLDLIADEHGGPIQTDAELSFTFGAMLSLLG